MPTYTLAARDRTTGRITLTANQETVVQFPDDAATVSVLNLTGDAPIWATFDDTAATVDGKRCVVIPAAITRVTFTPSTSGPTRVRLISTGSTVVLVGRV